MILTTAPADTDYVLVEAVSYELPPGVEHHGIVINLHRGKEVMDSSCIFYHIGLSAVQRELQMRRDLRALYLHTTLEKQFAFVCPEEELRNAICEELEELMHTPRTSYSVLSRLA
ncbi:hypothetical protein AURDEDRAFT_173340 [Auricularia subglabra TFB-10046 SS5]|nr:hypothetical protein AURDEDRAFT_173340 [Auricularia subglabra TFB-10046 SS5]